jgi:hypothetical protein
MALATSGAQAAPCTATGQISTWRGKPVAQAVQDIADHRARGRGHDADHLRQEGQRLLPALVEQSLGGQRGAAALQHRHQRTGPGGDKVLDHQLVFRLAGEGGQPPGRDHFHPLLRGVCQARRDPFPDDRGQDAAVILEVQIDMPRARQRQTPDLAAHANAGEGAFDRAFHRARDFRNGELGRVARRPAARVVVDQIVHGATLAAARAARKAAYAATFTLSAHRPSATPVAVTGGRP